MKTAFIAALALMSASAPAFAWTCYSANSAGATFYGVGFYEFQAARNAVAACQLNTPYGYACWLTTCSFY